MLLTDIKVKKSSAKSKSYKLSDEKGLLLLVHFDSSKYWSLKYRFTGKKKSLVLGIYPDV